MKKILVAFTCTAALSLMGCIATTGEKQTLGTVIGAVAGGVAGHEQNPQQVVFCVKHLANSLWQPGFRAVQGPTADMQSYPSPCGHQARRPMHVCDAGDAQ